MKLTLMMVGSLDGRTTKGDLPGASNIGSSEDFLHFTQIIESAKLIIMGSTTYENHKHLMEHKEGRTRIIVTSNPSRYDQEKIPGKLEFTSETPTALIQRLVEQGFPEGYLVGGAITNTEFLKEKLITEIWQTIEPKILGTGKGIVGEENVDIELQLISSEKLNSRGTLLLKYKVTY